MEAYIRYKRIHEDVTEGDLQITFNELVTNGWEIIYYNESGHITEGNLKGIFTVTIVAGKRQNNTL